MSAPMVKGGSRFLSQNARRLLSRQYVWHPNQASAATPYKFNCKSPPVTFSSIPPQQQPVRWAGLLNVSLTTTYVDLSDDDLHKAKEYFKSSDYEKKYGDKPVWADYRRNFKGQVAPERTRKRCINLDAKTLPVTTVSPFIPGGKYQARGQGESSWACSHPCPICKDENLLIDYRNVQLLEQFICPHSWEIYSYSVTGVCQRMQNQLVDAIHKSRSYGLIPYQAQHIHYNYDVYYGKERTDAR